MQTKSLLDCTLRDGGYINDWEFGHDVITGTYKRLDEAGVDYIEVGFIDDRRCFDINRTIVPNTESYNVIFENVEKKHAIPVAMIDYGTCSIENIGDVSSTFIDGIRVIFKKEKIEEALPFCKAIKEKGYKLFIQAISITSYSDIEVLDYINKINEIKPYAFSIVDTYGLLDEEKLLNYFGLLERNLHEDIIIGYHAHNNFQLAFSNSIKFLSQKTKHSLIVDATVYGMGKSAGNCPIELISMYFNENEDKNYDINQFLEILDTDLMPIYQKYYWGYKYNFYISAMQNCHPNYVKDLLDKKTLSVSAINQILSEIPDNMKLLYNQNYIETAYMKHQSIVVDDKIALKEIEEEIGNREIVLIGPGSSIVCAHEHIKTITDDRNRIVFSINFKPENLKTDYVFVSNSKRYSRLVNSKEIKNRDYKLIVTSNITPYDGQVDYILNYAKLLDESGQSYDNALLLCLTALEKLGVKRVMLAGFDGFSNEIDYYDVSYSFAGNENYNIQNNDKIIQGLKRLNEKIEFCFITKSLYQDGLNAN